MISALIFGISTMLIEEEIAIFLCQATTSASCASSLVSFEKCS